MKYTFMDFPYLPLSSTEEAAIANGIHQYLIDNEFTSERVPDTLMPSTMLKVGQLKNPLVSRVITVSGTHLSIARPIVYYKQDEHYKEKDKHQRTLTTIKPSGTINTIGTSRPPISDKLKLELADPQLLDKLKTTLTQLFDTDTVPAEYLKLLTEKPK